MLRTRVITALLLFALFFGALFQLPPLGDIEEVGEQAGRPIQFDRLDRGQDLAHLAGAVIRNQAITYNRTNALRAEIEEIIATGAFTCVFQPILDLESGKARWYEALTRFADETPPDIRFAAAREAGVEERLEEATARAALDAARDLPADMALSLNFSPAAIANDMLTDTHAEGHECAVMWRTTSSIS